MPSGPSARVALLSAAALSLLAGCEGGEFGFSGRDAEWARRGAFSVVSATTERAVVSAQGRQVAIEPPPGFCLSSDSVETSDRSAFVLIGDCVLEDAQQGAQAAGGGLDLPAGVPGIITVSVSGDPGFSADGAGDVSQLERYLATPEGRALLGRGGDGAQVSIVETRRAGDILYLLVEDRAAAAVPLLAPRFWRAFVELNGRLAVVTVSGFRDMPMDEDEMLRHLGDQVRQLQVANAAPVDEPPIQFAAAAPRGDRRPDTGSGDGPVDTEGVDAQPAGEPIASGETPDRAPETSIPERPSDWQFEVAAGTAFSADPAAGKTLVGEDAQNAAGPEFAEASARAPAPETGDGAVPGWDLPVPQAGPEDPEGGPVAEEIVLAEAPETPPSTAADPWVMSGASQLSAVDRRPETAAPDPAPAPGVEKDQATAAALAAAESGMGGQGFWPVPTARPAEAQPGAALVDTLRPPTRLVNAAERPTAAPTAMPPRKPAR